MIIFCIVNRVPTSTGKMGKSRKRRELYTVRGKTGNSKFYQYMQEVREKSMSFGSVREKSGKLY